MSAAKSTRPAASSAKAANAPAAQTFVLPTLSSLLAPTLSNNVNRGNEPCNCGCCCQTSTTVCLTFDTTWLQNLVNMFPKVQITNNNSCVDNDCGCDDEEEPGK